MTTDTKQKAAGAINTNGLHTDTNKVDSPIGSAVNQANTATIAAQYDLTLNVTDNEVRVDSRVLAKHLGSKHQSLYELVKDHRTDFQQLGILRFQTGVIDGRGQPVKFVMLNEDQATLALAYSKNTKRVRELKVKLVKAFGMARQKADMRRTEYLPSLRQLQDAIHAKSMNSSNQSRVQMNFAKLVNKTVGIEAGQRAAAPVGKQALLIVAQQVVVQAMEVSVDHHDGYQRAKQSMQALAALTTPQSLPPASTGRSV